MDVKDNISYIPINRSLFDHFLWKESRTFSKCEAWLDLVQLARFEQSQAKELIGGKLITWQRGQLAASIRYMAERWGWGKHKVEDFLKLLEKEKMILKDNSQGQLVITLLNYEKHNRGQQKGQQNPPPQSISGEHGDTGGTGVKQYFAKTDKNRGQQKGQLTNLLSESYKDVGDTTGDTEGTAGGHGGDKTNKENKENKGNKDLESGACAPPPPKKSFKNFSESDFIEELAIFKNDFPREILNDFFKYWKEKSAGGKMRFQLEKTWETKLRLEKWAGNQQKFEHQKSKVNGSHQQSNSRPNGKSAGASELLNSLRAEIGINT